MGEGAASSGAQAFFVLHAYCFGRAPLSHTPPLDGTREIWLAFCLCGLLTLSHGKRVYEPAGSSYALGLRSSLSLLCRSLSFPPYFFPPASRRPPSSIPSIQTPKPHHGLQIKRPILRCGLCLNGDFVLPLSESTMLSSWNKPMPDKAQPR